MKLLWSDDAWDDYLYWQKQDKKTLNRINILIKDVGRNGYKCKGKPEPLLWYHPGYWSIRIDKANRLVFRIVNDTLEIVQCRTHYGDK